MWESLSPEEFTGLANRAWDATLAGRYTEACELYDRLFTERIALGDLRNRGITYLLTADLENALGDFLDSRLLPGKLKSVNEFVGATLWLMGSYAEACEDWANEIRRRRSKELAYVDEAGGVQVPALLWWASVRLEDEKWKSLAQEGLKSRWKTRRCRESDWPGPLVPVLLGQRDPLELLSAAASSSEFVHSRRICQAHFYIAAVLLAANDRAGYATHMAEAVTARAGHTDADYRILKAEYHLARSEPAGLASQTGGPWPTRIS